MAGFVIYTHPDELSKWDRRFIELANHVAAWSKGPPLNSGVRGLGLVALPAKK